MRIERIRTRWMPSSRAPKVTMAELNRQQSRARCMVKAVLPPQLTVTVAIFLLTVLAILLEVAEGGRKQAKSG